LESLASPVTNAVLLEELIEKTEQEYLEDYSDESAASLPQVRCLVCRSCRRWEEELLLSFIEKMRNADFRAAYERSSGLCLPHFSGVLKSISGPKERAFLIESGRYQLATLRQELRLLISKAQNKDRSRGKESDAAYRAIAKIVGGKNYRAGCDESKEIRRQSHDANASKSTGRA
jgi:hypothetical protein